MRLYGRSKNVVGRRNHKPLVCGATRSMEHAIIIIGVEQYSVGNIIAIEACLVDGIDTLHKLRSQLAHGVYRELHKAFARRALCPHVVDRQIGEEIVVRTTHLEHALATLHILHEVRSIAPNGVVRTHVYRCIEAPSWPCLVLRRVGCAMEEHVVYASTEHKVHIWFHLA